MTGGARAFIGALCADRPAADRTTSMALYGWLIGSWDLDVAEFEKATLLREADEAFTELRRTTGREK